MRHRPASKLTPNANPLSAAPTNPSLPAAESHSPGPPAHNSQQESSPHAATHHLRSAQTPAKSPPSHIHRYSTRMSNNPRRSQYANSSYAYSETSQSPDPDSPLPPFGEQTSKSVCPRR